MQGWEDMCFFRISQQTVVAARERKNKKHSQKDQRLTETFFLAGIRLKGKDRNSQKWLGGFYSGA